MSTQLKITAAHNVNNALLPAEASLKASAIATTELVLIMLRQHEAAGLPDAVGLAAIGHASRASSLSIEAREAEIRAHGALNRDLKAVGLEHMYGKFDDVPPNDGSTFVLPFIGAEMDQPQPA